MNTSNPALRGFGNVGALGVSYQSSDIMTVDGTIYKSGVLSAILIAAFAFTWTGLSQAHLVAAWPVFVGLIGGLVLAMIIIFKPTTAPYLSPAYAGAEGFVLAAISFPLEARYPGIVLQAAALTMATVVGMLIAYRTGLIVVNNTFRAVIVGATLTIALYYVAGMICSMFGILLPGIGIQGGWLAIGISLVIVVIAAMNLALDFDMIAKNAGNAPKYMEWYGAFSLMVTIVWLYIEILRLLGNIRNR